VCSLLTLGCPLQEGVEAWPYKAVGAAMEVIPRTLAQNCGANVIRTLTKLRAKVGG
jgi:T-complex protein 1 subunit gamma